MRQFEKIPATFAPAQQGDLCNGAAAFVGVRCEWRAVWVVECGPYAGQWAMQPLDASAPFAWAPLCDLQP